MTLEGVVELHTACICMANIQSVCHCNCNCDCNIALETTKFICVNVYESKMKTFSGRFCTCIRATIVNADCFFISKLVLIHFVLIDFTGVDESCIFSVRSRSHIDEVGVFPTLRQELWR